MFTLDGKLTFITIDQNYLKKLHSACSEVYYKANGYESKHETAKKYHMGKDDIWVAEDKDNVKHILSVMDIKKMIPIIDGVYSRVNINPDKSDTDEVIGRANKLYDKQMETGKVVKFCCDFKALEKAAGI